MLHKVSPAVSYTHLRAHETETNQTVIAGMGELHLEILVDRMLREFKVEANIGAPQVSYRETIRSSSKGEGKYARQTGGKGQYGHVIIEMEPVSYTHLTLPTTLVV